MISLSLTQLKLSFDSIFALITVCQLNPIVFTHHLLKQYNQNVDLDRKREILSSCGIFINYFNSVGSGLNFNFFSKDICKLNNYLRASRKKCSSFSVNLTVKMQRKFFRTYKNPCMTKDLMRLFFREKRIKCWKFAIRSHNLFLTGN